MEGERLGLPRRRLPEALCAELNDPSHQRGLGCRHSSRSLGSRLRGQPRHRHRCRPSPRPTHGLDVAYPGPADRCDPLLRPRRVMSGRLPGTYAVRFSGWEHLYGWGEMWSLESPFAGRSGWVARNPIGVLSREGRYPRSRRERRGLTRRILYLGASPRRLLMSARVVIHATGARSAWLGAERSSSLTSSQSLIVVAVCVPQSHGYLGRVPGSGTIGTL